MCMAVSAIVHVDGVAVDVAAHKERGAGRARGAERGENARDALALELPFISMVLPYTPPKVVTGYAGVAKPSGGR